MPTTQTEYFSGKKWSVYWRAQLNPQSVGNLHTSHILSLVDQANVVLCKIIVQYVPYIIRKEATTAATIQKSDRILEIVNRYQLQKSSLINPLSAYDTYWRYGGIWRQWAALVQVTACCLTAPSHYQNQCWLRIKGGLCRSSESNFKRSVYESNPWHVFEY